MFERMRIGFHFFTVAAMAAFSMVSFTACSDDAGSNPSPSAAEIQEKCRREGRNELCLVVSDKGKIEYFQSYMDITDTLKERMSNDFAGTDISVYTSVDSTGNAWVEKQCNAENEGSVLEFLYYPYKFLYGLYFKCSANKWKNVSDEDVHCPATAEIGDICDGETFVHGFGGSITPIYIYTSSGWTWFNSSSMGNFCRAVVVPLNQYGDSRTPFATLILDSDTDHPKYQFARFDTDSLEKYMSGYCDVKWDWSGCDIENGEVCVERSRIYIKSNGECDEDKTIMTESVRGTYYNQLANMYITETCDAANNGKLATVVDSIVFPNGQVLKQELQYQCDSDLKRWDRIKQNVSGCEKPDAKIGDVCPIRDNGDDSVRGPYILSCYVYTESGWKEKGHDYSFFYGQVSSCEEILNAPKPETDCTDGERVEKTVDDKVYTYTCSSGEWLVWDVDLTANRPYANLTETPVDSAAAAD